MRGVLSDRYPYRDSRLFKTKQQSFQLTASPLESAGKAVAKDDGYIAVATAANRFIVIETAELGREIQVGERLSLLFSKGRPTIEIESGRAQ